MIKKKKSQLPIATQRPGLRISCLSSPPKIGAQFCSHGKEESCGGLKAWLSRKVMNALANAVRSARLMFSNWIHHTGAIVRLSLCSPSLRRRICSGISFYCHVVLRKEKLLPPEQRNCCQENPLKFQASMNEMFFSEHPGRPGKEQ